MLITTPSSNLTKKNMTTREVEAEVVVMAIEEEAMDDTEIKGMEDTTAKNEMHQGWYVIDVIR